MASDAVATQRGLQGLTEDQVRDRVKAGLVNDVPDAHVRTVGDIVRANVVTRFNILLGILLVVVIAVAPVQDALFGVVLVVNTVIGIVQELRAKRTLDKLALLSAPKARVLRAGNVQDIAVSGVVLDDVLELRPGDQLVVDGTVLAANGMEINESLLTGESDPVLKQPGDSVLSGSFVAAGSGRMAATKVGKDAYAVTLTAEAKKFTLVKSELRAGIDVILVIVSWAIVPTVALLVWSQLEATNSVKEGLRGAIAGAVGMVPQGLVLLTSVAFAVGVVRLGRRQALVQELPAIEILARVDVVCFDKTGTLTEGRLVVEDLIQLDPAVDPRPAIAAVAASDPAPNATLAAVAEGFPPVGDWIATSSVPFASDRGWSGATFENASTWVVGAPDVIGLLPGARERAQRLAMQGHRVLAVARTSSPLRGTTLPDGLQSVALIVLGDRIRADTVDTLAFFASQGVQAKVISGDHPATVGAIAARAGLHGADSAVDGRHLPENAAEFSNAIESTHVFGRVSPRQKRRMVQALQARGHTVAMTGDGVNDVLALKDADIGVAMGSGSSATRAVAQIVLLDGAFSSLPVVVAEGRRVIANIERVANLFVTKTVYAMALALAVGVAGWAFPFVPRHLTLVGTLTIGAPAFVLALAPSNRRARPGFVKRVLRFAIPTGALAAAATFTAYGLAVDESLPLIQSRTTATIVLASIGMFALIANSRPLTTGTKWLIGSMIALLVVVLISPWWREFFELEMPPLVVLLAATGIVGLTGAVMYVSLRTLGWLQHVPEILTPEVARETLVALSERAKGLGQRLRRRDQDDGNTSSKTDQPSS
ncbi:MAG: HAD-IC family P-type ATPase [Acidimicrobiia bacterium]|nr:HAD-IC family P-type ATPase [Acidimicrobiia bacterium]